MGSRKAASRPKKPRDELAAMRRKANAAQDLYLFAADCMAKSSAGRFFVPVKTVSEQNGSHGHWRGVAKRTKAQRESARACAQRFAPLATFAPPSGPWRVKLTRVSRGRLDGHDNLRSALKHVVDGIADFLGVNDGDRSAVVWDYAEERGEFGVWVEITVGT